ncbi:ferredoxin reductase [Amycolatopsis sp. NPDC059027]|uniref:ferredoxin reductase n=1 Tax=Amycolatopsis sp. NPDC059027 TaxID=3346709 RepID=UPI00366DFADD
MAVTPGSGRAGWRYVRRVLGSGVVTALAEPHGVDRYLGLVSPLWSVGEVRAVVAGVVHQTAQSVTLRLRPNGNWEGARPGQYVRLAVEIDGVRRTRCFSVAGAGHGDGTIEITAKVNPGGTVSRYLKEHARRGLVVVLSQAEGEFVLPPALPGHVLLISGGSGITPVMALLRGLLAQGYQGRVTFLHYAFTPWDVIYREELAALDEANPRLTLAYSYTGLPGAGRLDGRFRREHLDVAPGYADALTYVCGPASLMDAVGALWATDGIADRLRIERFTLAPPTSGSGPVTGEVRFARSGRTVRNDGRTLLEQAEAAGLRPDHGCRMGICHSCTAVQSAGAVRNVLNGVVSAEPGQRVQLCVTAPCGDVELDL